MGKLEERLQQDIFTAHWNMYPDERKRLFSVNNNSVNRIKGAIMKTLGVVKGVSDLIYLNPRTLKITFIELKVAKTGRQSKDQKEFEKMVTSDGHEYVIVKSIEDFNGVTGLNIK